MFLVINDISLVIIGIIAMALLFGTLMITFAVNQKKRLQYQKDMEKLREAQQNQLIEAAVRSEETERHRIAEALHDEVGAILSSSKLHLQGINSGSLAEKDQKLFAKSEELLNEGIHKVRTISHNLHSNILKEFGLNEAIAHFIQKLTDGSAITATVELENSGGSRTSDNDITVYRLIQELVNNVLKHARPTNVSITSVREEKIIHYIIQHNGRGLDQQEFETLRFQKEGLGLKNIQNRIILLQGTINFVKDQPDCLIHLYIPEDTK